MENDLNCNFLKIVKNNEKFEDIDLDTLYDKFCNNEIVKRYCTENGTVIIKKLCQELINLNDEGYDININIGEDDFELSINIDMIIKSHDSKMNYDAFNLAVELTDKFEEAYRYEIMIDFNPIMEHENVKVITSYSSGNDKR